MTSILILTRSVSITEIPKPPTITMDDKVYKVLPGEEVTLRAKVAGSPKPTAEWSVNGTLIKPSPNKIPQIENEYATLTIQKVMPEDGGEYTIRVRNEHGDVEETVTLIIMSKIWSQSY